VREAAHSSVADARGTEPHARGDAGSSHAGEAHGIESDGWGARGQARERGAWLNQFD
jgi:hypothetical protein